RSQDEPGLCRRPVNRSVGLTVAVIISRSSNIAARTERECKICKILAPQNEPIRIGRPEECNVGLPVASVISRYRLVSRSPKPKTTRDAVRTLLVIPLTDTRPEYRKIGLVITVKIEICRSFDDGRCDGLGRVIVFVTL